MDFIIRKAALKDVSFLAKLEKESFKSFQQNSKKNIVNSVKSGFQETLIIQNNTIAVGAITLFKYPKALRIYSIAILPTYQNKGIGHFLLKHVIDFATKNNFERIILEVDTANLKLINWYLSKEFTIKNTVKNYYKKGKHAHKMELKTTAVATHKKLSNVIVINEPTKWTFSDVNAKVISVKEYINNPTYATTTGIRIFNLCSSYKYQSYGYYVSLLASARGQRSVPSATTIRDFKIQGVINSVASDIIELINTSLKKVSENTFSITVYFGYSNKKGCSLLASKLFHLFEAPLFEVTFIKADSWIIKSMKVLTLDKIIPQDVEQVNASAKKYFSKKRFQKSRLVNYKYDIAVLVNPNEKTPPSCAKALQKFKKAATKKGLYLEFITKADVNKINEFDALFIRETTNVNDYTYEFSRIAYSEGLVVIDDPWSIMKCSNKIYQNEIFKKNKILTPETVIFTKNLFKKEVLNNMAFPLVLKQPDSAFSLGMTKVENKEEAIVALKQLFQKSDMIVCQQFLYSDFDWRIGILDNKPIFACKYYMSKDHWQIYNWKEGGDENAGDWETLPVDKVPKIVVQTALKAAGLIGDGLYGVDLKMIGNKVYIVEVNDNPNIDAGIEDNELKDGLYDTIIDSIYKRIEIAKNIQQIDFE